MLNAVIDKIDLNLGFLSVPDPENPAASFQALSRAHLGYWFAFCLEGPAYRALSECGSTK